MGWKSDHPARSDRSGTPLAGRPTPHRSDKLRTVSRKSEGARAVGGAVPCSVHAGADAACLPHGHAGPLHPRALLWLLHPLPRPAPASRAPPISVRGGTRAPLAGAPGDPFDHHNFE
eukprot:1176632-Prorocentrum_minimum.AAC.2